MHPYLQPGSGGFFGSTAGPVIGGLLLAGAPGLGLGVVLCKKTIEIYRHFDIYI